MLSDIRKILVQESNCVLRSKKGKKVMFGKYLPGEQLCAS